MGKIATSTKEQISILEKRGMIIDIPIEKTEEILLDIGYYRLGFYWYPFEKDKEHNFNAGTKFSDVVCLYYLDADLRSCLQKYLKRIEVNFRTKLIYYISNKYKDDPIWFTNTKVMFRWFIDQLDIKLYTNNFKLENKQIKLHHSKYRNDKYAPAWKTFEFLTFGSILTIFEALKDEKAQQEIANLYGLNNLKTFKNFMFTIKFIRNICAHGGVLYDLNMPKGIYKIPRIQFNNNNNQSLDAGIKTMLFILGAISNERKIEMENDLKQIFINHDGNGIITSIIKNKIGYLI